MRILITGGRGQLATDLVPALADHAVTALGRDQLDIANPDQVEAAFRELRPDVIVNTAAFHKVDLCETEPESSFTVNAAVPQRLARAARDTGALLVHFSTDYVFDGHQHIPYRETDPVNPISVYGASKAAGEMAIRATTDRHLIIRTSGLYGHAGATTAHGNFPTTMLRLAAAGGPISVVDDQVLTPSATLDVARATAGLLDTQATGTFHVTNSGECSWYQFAAELFRLAGVDADVRPVSQGERPVPARRPAYSVLAHEGIMRLGLPDIRPWQEALGDYVRGLQGRVTT